MDVLASFMVVLAYPEAVLASFAATPASSKATPISSKVILASSEVALASFMASSFKVTHMAVVSFEVDHALATASFEDTVDLTFVTAPLVLDSQA